MDATMLPGAAVLAGGFILAAIIGAIGHKTHFCTMGAVSDWVNMGAKGRLSAWFSAIAVAILSVSLLEWQGLIVLNETRPPYRSAVFNIPRHLLGGLLFGIGMTLAGGCTSKTLIRIGGGNGKSLLVALVVGVCAYLMTKTMFYAVLFHSWLQYLSLDLAAFGWEGQDLGSIAAAFSWGDPASLRLLLGLIVAAALCIFIARTVGWRGNQQNIIAGSVIGLCVAAGWYLSAGPLGQDWIDAVQWLDAQPLSVGPQSFTFVNPLGETVYYITEPRDTLRLTFGVFAVFGVIAGSFIYALFSSQLRFEWFHSGSDLAQHVIGGVLMGIGGVLALGCTIGQGISGISTLALGSFISLIAIILGSAATMKVQLYLLVYEDANWLDALLTAGADLRLLPRSLRRLQAI